MPRSINPLLFHRKSTVPVENSPIALPAIAFCKLSRLGRLPGYCRRGCRQRNHRRRERASFHLRLKSTFLVVPVAERLIGGLSAAAKADRRAAGQVEDVALGVTNDELARHALDAHGAVVSNDDLGQRNLLAEDILVCSLFCCFLPSQERLRYLLGLDDCQKNDCQQQQNDRSGNQFQPKRRNFGTSAQHRTYTHGEQQIHRD
jgi:hypothetical protein